MTALYNEIEPYAAAWLRNLSDAGHIARGAVDTRSVRDLDPTELVGLVQFHTFAGIGAWSYALRLAGWPDDRPVWTGSCPCQPFSQAGKGGGFDDERHLWPDWFRLIRECRPDVVFGEQVASPDGYHWLDLVRSDLEGAGYAVGVAVLPAAGVGAPHGRHRIFFVADACGQRRDGVDTRVSSGGQDQDRAETARRGDAVGGRGAAAEARGFVADSDARRRGARGFAGDGDEDGGGRARPVHAPATPDAGAPRPVASTRSEGRREVGPLDGGRREGSGTQVVDERPVYGGALLVAHPASAGREGLGPVGSARPRNEGAAAERGGSACGVGDASSRARFGVADLDSSSSSATPGERQGQVERDVGEPHHPWRDVVWLPCRDGKARPTQPGLLPLAHGHAGRMARLRPGFDGSADYPIAPVLKCAGNAIVPHVAAAFIRAFLDVKAADPATPRESA